MHKLTINNFGPISKCELTCKPFIVLTGEQASGKSTVAKALYYFRTVKDDVYTVVESRAFDFLQQNISVQKMLVDMLRRKFVKTFGPSWGGEENNMLLSYSYSDTCWINIKLTHKPLPNYVYIELSPSLKDFLREHEHALTDTPTGIPELQKRRFQTELREFFNDDYETVYIPAGRSMLTLLSQNLSYLYKTMDEPQRRMLDYCTQRYIETILTIKPEFYEGLEGIMAYYGTRRKIPDAWNAALTLINRVLNGTYKVENGEERILIDDGNYVKINFASSGQQDAVWIMNLLFYYLVQDRPAMFIIEEPESHLFPSSQKYIMELISLVCNQGHSMLVTTHSPYVLGALNNLLYAAQFRKSGRQKEAAQVIPSSLWLDVDSFSAYFVKGGKVEDCIDHEINQIRNEVIDDISNVINDEYDSLLGLECEESENAAE